MSMKHPPKIKPRRWWYAIEIDKEKYAPACEGLSDNLAPALFDTRNGAETGAFLDHGEKIVQVKIVKRRTGWKGKPIKHQRSLKQARKVREGK